MKSIPIYLLFGFTFLSASLYAQTTVMVVTTSGERVSGELNSDLEDLNTKGLTLLLDGGVSKKLPATEIKSLASDGIPGYSLHILQIDQKSLITSRLSLDKEPEFLPDTVLLEKIVSGPVSLYRLIDKNHREHFFIQQGTDTPEELIFTRYLSYNKRKMVLLAKENLRYKKQLSDIFEACSATFPLINEASYEWGDLSKIVELGSLDCLKVPADQIIVATVPQAITEVEITTGIGIGYAHLYGSRFPFDIDDASHSLKPGYFASIAGLYYPAALKGRIGFLAELNFFNLKQTIYSETITSADIYQNNTLNINYHYFAVNLVVRKMLKGKNRPFWQAGYSYGYSYNQENPLDEEIYFYGATRFETEPEGYPLRNQENAIVFGGGIMPGNFTVKAVGRLSNGSTSAIGQRSFHLLGHLCIGYRL